MCRWKKVGDERKALFTKNSFSFLEGRNRLINYCQ